MSTLNEHYTLHNGIEIPKLALGTWFIEDGDADDAVRTAIELGYRHIDTAQAYGNEAGVGRGVLSAGVDREAVFVTTKLAAEVKTYDEAVAEIDASLARMGLEYIDLMLIHSPQPWAEFGGDDRFHEGNKAAWRAMEDAYEAGKLRAIGISNFKESDIDNLLEDCRVKPMVNQVLAHVTNTPQALIDYSRSKGMVVEAYSPVGHGELFKNDKLAVMAERYGVSVPQLCIRYTLQLDLLPIPKTANPAHMQNNADVDFVIAEEDMQSLIGMEKIADYGEHSVFPVYNQD